MYVQIERIASNSKLLIFRRLEVVIFQVENWKVTLTTNDAALYVRDRFATTPVTARLRPDRFLVRKCETLIFSDSYLRNFATYTRIGLRRSRPIQK